MTDINMKELIIEVLRTLSGDQLVDIWNEFAETCERLKENYHGVITWHEDNIIRSMDMLDCEFGNYSHTEMLEEFWKIDAVDTHYWSTGSGLMSGIITSYDDFPFKYELDNGIAEYVIETGDTLNSEAIAKALDTIARL